MSLMNSTAERLRRANALWHAYLAIPVSVSNSRRSSGTPELERQTIAGALATAIRNWSSARAGLAARHGAGSAAVVAARVTPPAAAPAAAPAEAAKPSRYLRGVR